MDAPLVGVQYTVNMQSAHAVAAGGWMNLLLLAWERKVGWFVQWALLRIFNIHEFSRIDKAFQTSYVISSLIKTHLSRAYQSSINQ